MGIETATSEHNWIVISNEPGLVKREKCPRPTRQVDLEVVLGVPKTAENTGLAIRPAHTTQGAMREVQVGRPDKFSPKAVVNIL